MSTRTSRPIRRFTQFSLRTFFVLLTLGGLLFGWKMNQARAQRRAVEWARDGQARVYYDYQVDSYYEFATLDLPVPSWMVDALGIDFFADVVTVDFGTRDHCCGTIDLPRVKDISNLRHFKNLRLLDLGRTDVVDLTPVANLSNLEYLMLSHVKVSDLEPLNNLTNLKGLMINDTDVTDLTPLEKLPQLEFLSIADTQVTNLQPLVGMKSLSEVQLEFPDYIPIGEPREECLKELESQLPSS